MGLKAREAKIYANIISDGTIRVKTSETDPEAVRRDYELKDGTKGTKFERVYNELSGLITGISFYDGDFGKTLHVTVTDDEMPVILSMNMSSNYAEDLLKKIPSLDLLKPVVLKPYSFEDDKKKLRKGISLVQNEKKITNFFYDVATKKVTNGFPEVEKDKKYDKDDWKIYFMTTRKFLEKFITDNICPMFLGLTPEGIAEAVGGKIIDEKEMTPEDAEAANPSFV
jgi:hypothetical protein